MKMFTQSGAHAYNTESMNMKKHSDTDSPAAPGLVLSNPPHIKDSQTVKSIMWMVVAALVPAVAFSIHLFGVHALVLICAAVATAVAVEALMQLAMKKPITVTDGSAVLTGLLLAMNVPPHAPIWMVAIGSAFSIIIAKQLFGGLGYNIFNPALAARAILLASWPVAITTWAKPVNSFLATDAVTTATQLGLLKEAQRVAGSLPETYGYLDLFLGNVPGSLGETCKVTLLAGAVVLFALKIIDWRIPTSFIAAVVLFSFFFGRDPLAAVLSGGVILGAFFMATDMVTSPSGKAGKLIFGAGCGTLTALIRSYGGFPEGVCYSILLMNCFTPLIEKYVRPRPFGAVKAKA